MGCDVNDNSDIKHGLLIMREKKKNNKKGLFISSRYMHILAVLTKCCFEEPNQKAMVQIRIKFVSGTEAKLFTRSQKTSLKA